MSCAPELCQDAIAAVSARAGSCVAEPCGDTRKARQLTGLIPVRQRAFTAAGTFRTGTRRTSVGF